MADPVTAVAPKKRRLEKFHGKEKQISRWQSTCSLLTSSAKKTDPIDLQINMVVSKLLGKDCFVRRHANQRERY